MVVVAILCGGVGIVVGYLAARSRVATLTAQLKEANHRAEDESRLVEKFEKLSNDALRTSREELLTTAEQTFKKAQLEAKGELDQNRLKIEHLVEPVKENLDKLERFVQDSNNQRDKQFGALGEQMKQVSVTNQQIQTEAAQLKNVLRSSASARGRWGEMQLANVLKQSGMVDYCDFAEQQTSSDEERRARADVVVNLPGGRLLSIDAKAPYEAFERAATCEDPELQRDLYIEHAKALRNAVDGLAKRKYWEMYKPSVGYCVLFVPGEGMLGAALMSDSQLWNDAFEKQVLLVGPTGLIPLLMNASLSWQEDKQVEFAAEIAKSAKELYARLLKMTSHIRAVGKNLTSTVKAYDDMIGSYENRVTPQARKLQELGVGDRDEIIQLDTVDKYPRALRQPDVREIESPKQVVIETFEEYWVAREAEG
jgi:DNA recombination protein RmuC